MEANHMVNSQNVPSNAIIYDIPNENQQQARNQMIIKSPKKKNLMLSENKFQQINKVTNPKKLLKSFKKIGRCLNNVKIDDLSNEQYVKICLILINKDDQNKPNSQVGELNDAYLFGLYHNRLGFKVFYLYNSYQSKYSAFLQLFLLNTNENLTIFYTGLNTVDFKSLNFNKSTTNQIDKDKCKIVYISDSEKNSSIFDIPCDGNHPDIISFTIGKIMHGIFIYYYCKTIFNDPKITLKRFFDRMKISLARFKETFAYRATASLNQNDPIYKNCVQQVFHELVDTDDDDEEESFEYNAGDSSDDNLNF